MILQQPFYDILPAYRPVMFETTIVVLTATQQAENALVTIYKGGVAIGPAIPYKSYRNSPSAFPGGTDYYFKIDIQKYVQDLLAPFTDLPSNFTLDILGDDIVNDDYFDTFRIEVDYDILNLTTGLVEPSIIATDVSNDFVIYTASLEPTESMDLSLYYGTLGFQDTVFLTKSARTLNVCDTDFAFLTVIQPDNTSPLSGFRVELYDANGALLDFGLSTTSAPSFSAQWSINSGFTSLSNMTYVDGSPNFANPLIAYYTVSFGVALFISPNWAYARQTEVFTYNLVSCCPNKFIRLHWMNLLGGVDSYTFTDNTDLAITTASERSQKSLGWELGTATPNDVSDIGNFKVKSTAKKSYRLSSKILTNSEATWLNELLTSPKVYAEINGQFISVIVQDTDQSINRTKGKIPYNIIATIANDPIIQRV